MCYNQKSLKFHFDCEYLLVAEEPFSEYEDQSKADKQGGK